MALGESHAKRMQTDLIIVAWHRSGIGAWYWAVLPYRQMNQSCGRQTAESAESCQKPVWNGEVRSSILCLQSIFCSLARWNLIRTWPCAGGAYQLGASASVSSSHPLSSLVPACRAAEEVKSTRRPDLLCRYFLRRPSRPRPARGKGYKLPSGKK